jgi:hypothetical protein
MTSSFVTSGLDTSHRAWSRRPIYVVARTIARIQEKPIAPSERSPLDGATPVEIAVESPGDELVEERPF